MNQDAIVVGLHVISTRLDNAENEGFVTKSSFPSQWQISGKMLLGVDFLY